MGKKSKLNRLKYYQPEFYGVTLGLFALFIWYITSLAVDRSVIPTHLDYLVQIISGAIGAAAGAIVAISITKRDSKKEIREKNRKGLNTAIFSLIRKMIAIENVKKEIDKFTSLKEFAFDMAPMKQPDYSNLKFDHDALRFLLDEGHPQLLLELANEEYGFHQAFVAIDMRNHTFVEKVRPKLQEIFESTPSAERFSDLAPQLPKQLYGAGLSAAIEMKRNIDETSASLKKTYFQIKSIARELFEGELFVEIQESDFFDKEDFEKK